MYLVGPCTVAGILLQALLVCPLWEHSSPKDSLGPSKAFHVFQRNLAGCGRLGSCMCTNRSVCYCNECLHQINTYILIIIKLLVLPAPSWSCVCGFNYFSIDLQNICIKARSIVFVLKLSLCAAYKGRYMLDPPASSNDLHAKCWLTSTWPWWCTLPWGTRVGEAGSSQCWKLEWPTASTTNC